jgi:hypothetical protein
LAETALRHRGESGLSEAKERRVYPKTEEFRGSREEVDWRRGF